MVAVFALQRSLRIAVAAGVRGMSWCWLYMGLQSEKWKPRLRFAVVLVLVAFVLASYALIWRNTPISLNEAQINMRTRNQLEAQLAIWLQKLPPESTLLMYLGDHVGALQQAGIPLQTNDQRGQSSDVEATRRSRWFVGTSAGRSIPICRLRRCLRRGQCVAVNAGPSSSGTGRDPRDRPGSGRRLSRPVITQVTLAPTNPMIKSGHRKSASGRPSSS